MTLENSHIEIAVNKMVQAELEKKKNNINKIEQKKIKEPVWCEKCGFSKTGDICQKCVEIEKEVQVMANDKKNATIASLGGLRAYEKYTVNNFNDKNILKDCLGYPNINIYITGAVGTGKTHLGTALIRKCENFNRFSSIQICRELRKTQSSANPALSEEKLIKNLSEIPLMIDDFGVEKTTEYTKQTLYEIIDKRYELGNGGLIITSNFELGKNRISSRLYEMCKIIKLDGNDFRLKKL